jgi:hypothetical protein
MVRASAEGAEVADLVILDGSTAKRASNLRRADIVARAGRWYRTRPLLDTAGFTPPRCIILCPPHHALNSRVRSCTTRRYCSAEVAWNRRMREFE